MQTRFSNSEGPKQLGGWAGCPVAWGGRADSSQAHCWVFCSCPASWVNSLSQVSQEERGGWCPLRKPMLVFTFERGDGQAMGLLCLPLLLPSDLGLTNEVTLAGQGGPGVPPPHPLSPPSPSPHAGLLSSGLRLSVLTAVSSFLCPFWTLNSRPRACETSSASCTISQAFFRGFNFFIFFHLRLHRPTWLCSVPAL